VTIPSPCRTVAPNKNSAGRGGRARFPPSLKRKMPAMLVRQNSRDRCAIKPSNHQFLPEFGEIGKTKSQFRRDVLDQPPPNSNRSTVGIRCRAVGWAPGPCISSSTQPTLPPFRLSPCARTSATSNCSLLAIVSLLNPVGLPRHVHRSLEDAIPIFHSITSSLGRTCSLSWG